ncbi:MAG: S41 family peptidase [candidate division Zixibacteria bacterium]|nr:S41 family peptidase [candidate division Zixibacteria bacterium]
MFRYTVQLFGITVFALTLIWFAGPGDAQQNTARTEPVLWADTVHINLDEANKTVEAPKPSGDSFLRSVKALNQAMFAIRNNYMEDVDVDKITKAGIDGMLSGLDRFSVLMEKSSYDQLMESTHGKYEGVGMQIDGRNNRIVVIAPIEGSPAWKRGIRAGDIIWSIDGKTTEGMSSNDASKMMRGVAGTSVLLQIKREGITEPIDFEVERAVIELKSVNYYGVVPGTTIGYVRLSRFAEETSQELRDAVSALNQQNITGLIFDLRSNGGGLLDQAKETAELFVKPGSDIVYTKGKDESSERRYKSERPPIYPDKPLVVLVDEGTASASEIVAGAIQDWDRGIIIGNTTYGKGLVQMIFPVSQDGTMQLKLTTAKYYVPSGRCIQKAEIQGKKPMDHPDVDEDSLGDTLSVKDREIFYTNGGRVVYGGGGIVPDIPVDRELWKPIELNLYRKQMFFDFAVKYVADHPDTRPDFQVTDETLAAFKQFIKDKGFSYKSALEVAVDQLSKTVTQEKDESLFADGLKQMQEAVKAEKDKDFDRSADYIRRAVQREIVTAIAGERGVYEHQILKTDKSIKEAVRVLTTPKEYGRLIKGDGAKKKSDS